MNEFPKSIVCRRRRLDRSRDPLGCDSSTRRRISLVAGHRNLGHNSKTQWDDELVNAGVVGRISHIAPAFVVFYGINFFSNLPEILVDGIRRVAVAVMILVGALAISSVLTATEAIYDRNPQYRQRPIKGYLQVVSILVYLLAGLLILAALMNRSPWIFVSGIGAMTAVLLLVFRDTILSSSRAFKLPAMT